MTSTKRQEQRAWEAGHSIPWLRGGVGKARDGLWWAHRPSNIKWYPFASWELAVRWAFSDRMDMAFVEDTHGLIIDVVLPAEEAV